MQQLAVIFQNAPKLSDLTVMRIKDSNGQLDFQGHAAKCLKKLHIENPIDFPSIKKLLQHTTYLKIFILHVFSDLSMLNADEWEKSIQSSLTHLKRAKLEFGFGMSYWYDMDLFAEAADRFQSDFWKKEYQCTIHEPLKLSDFTWDSGCECGF
ncbi:hypothetical protein I4U23_015423 [Adineta vaga]|nr:hypothetical protein I4U23_015423 [Adineta vaga]